MDKEEKRKSAERQALGEAASEAANRYGEAASEFWDGYAGTVWHNKVTGQAGLSKGLKDIADYKINSNNGYTNIKQQAGFSGEVLATSKKNAKNIIEKINKRYSRSNDVGLGNDMQVDIGQVNKKGSFIRNKHGKIRDGIQAKISGHYETVDQIRHSAEQNVRKMLKNGKHDWGRYEDIALPSEQISYAKEYAMKEAANLSEQAEYFRQQGDFAKAKVLDDKAQHYREANTRIKDLDITSAEAMEARMNPLRKTAKEIGSTAHAAGIEQAKAGAVIGGVVAGAKNLVALVSGEKNPKEAICDVAKDTIKASAISYATAAGGALIKTGITATGNGTIKVLSRTNMPAMIVTAVIDVGASLKRFAKGEINELQLAEELGEKGTCTLVASWGAAIGSAVFPGIGTVIGSMGGFLAASVLYQGCMKVYQDEILSQKRQKYIHAYVIEALHCLDIERENLRNALVRQNCQRQMAFSRGFLDIDTGLTQNDFDCFAGGVNQLVQAVGGELHIRTFAEFDAFMQDESTMLEF